jgi:lipopolysaccharide transport system ATP-binding protein
MGDIAIRAENLSKAYRITATHYRHDTLRGHLAEGLKSMLQVLSRSHSQKETFWPLRDVSFEVKRGDTVGIVGRNGAGKSTLLKILSRITDPTSGRAEIYGRIGSLLEVGTGFDHDLTGLENIYLSGAILGMRKTEIDRKLDEIVAFSEVGKFIDTPVKRYSSGMYVRLAFAVAAHLEPEILIVDEVLAVGASAWGRWATWPRKAGRCSSSPTTCRRLRVCADGPSGWTGDASRTRARRTRSSPSTSPRAESRRAK